MSEKNWTPGPWRTKHGGQTLFVDASIGGGMAQEVAACGPTQAWEQQEANAHLIAAAPDLVEALEDVVYQMRNAPPEVLADYFDMDRAHKALAKAYGETK